ncbi:MAG: vWA domain-containing protein [Myxococcaceae bacterium]|nr:vWA domain-containing protein [Myxococcaceae bacterium]
MRVLLVVAVGCALACGRTEVVREALVDVPLPDAGPVDAGRPRDGGVDAGQPDAGPVDAGFVPKPCITGTFTLSPAEPVVMLVLDRSGSMDLVFSNGVTRWDSLVASLRATLPAVNQTMQVGGLAFPTNSVDDCLVPDTSGVWPARGNVPLLISTLESIRPSGATPTADALRVASQVLRGRRAGNAARAMVLATDGAPTCGASPLDSTLQRLRQAASEGIPTWVIGIADEPVLRGALQQMAVAGSRPRPGPQGFYSAQSAAELQLAFSTIRDQVGACSFLTNSVPDARGSIVVTLDGVAVPQDDTGLRGWRWTDRENGELALVGSVCERAVARPASVVVTVGCGGP